ncbi:Holliday junction resolvase RuvX [Candidatus Falkowbacteria bacterium HGW-Falkowbacteria-1]|jgi:putative transcription antitermination factor YqgF|uniref:Putative pre-16S rRNA nuclease n=1 Tax=Candidatus Falkowbacteria bacterium HGW-Falkowbacteria-1 TaxID=2013768 RepID=A0A2N2E978_9BACT|nr:MAG: Holliday junction resolvase RuvX [Candidatus Falkowbacteria bacterium HGW-Falkowbacteria-1]
MKNYLGIDWGEKRIGLSLADSENNTATPFKTVNNLSELVETIKSENLNCLVIGQPKSLEEGEVRNRKFTKFINILEERIKGLNLDVFFVDERFTSLEADSIMNKKLNNNRDSLSAMIILQAYLDKLQYDKNKGHSFK